MAAGIAVDPSGQYAYVTMSAAVATPSTVVAQFNIEPNEWNALADEIRPQSRLAVPAQSHRRRSPPGKYAYADERRHRVGQHERCRIRDRCAWAR